MPRTRTFGLPLREDCGTDVQTLTAGSRSLSNPLRRTARPSAPRRSRSWRGRSARRRCPRASSMSLSSFFAASPSTLTVVCGQVRPLLLAQLEPALLQRRRHRVQVGGLGAHLEALLAVVHHVLGAGLDGLLHHRVLGGAGLHGDRALLVEDGTSPSRRRAEVSAAPGEGGAHVAGGAVACCR